jgi:hypothetical protein
VVAWPSCTALGSFAASLHEPREGAPAPPISGEGRGKTHTRVRSKRTKSCCSVAGSNFVQSGCREQEARQSRAEQGRGQLHRSVVLAVMRCSSYLVHCTRCPELLPVRSFMLASRSRTCCARAPAVRNRALLFSALVWANELDRDDTTPPSPWAILLHSHSSDTVQIIGAFGNGKKPPLLQL